jgi:hypothetical protein
VERLNTEAVSRAAIKDRLTKFSNEVLITIGNEIEHSPGCSFEHGTLEFQNYNNRVSINILIFLSQEEKTNPKSFSLSITSKEDGYLIGLDNYPNSDVIKNVEEAGNTFFELLNKAIRL